MVKPLLAGLAALFLSAAAAQAASAPQNTPPPAPGPATAAAGDIWLSVDAQQLTALALEAGAVETDVVNGDEGFLVRVRFPNGMSGYISGYDCGGQTGATATCGEIELGGVFTADNGEHARRLERDMTFLWLADYADAANSEYIVWRRDCLHGGITRAQVAHLITTLESQLAAVAVAIWPDESQPGPTNQPVET